MTKMEEDLRQFEQTLGVKLETRVSVELPKNGYSDDNKLLIMKDSFHQSMANTFRRKD